MSKGSQPIKIDYLATRALIGREGRSIFRQNGDSDYPREIIEKNFTTRKILIRETVNRMSHKYETFYKILISRNEIDFDGSYFIGIGGIQAKAKNDKGESFKTTWQFELTLICKSWKTHPENFPIHFFRNCSFRVMSWTVLLENLSTRIS